MREIFLTLVGACIGASVGGLIAIYAALCAVKRTEFYRLANELRLELRKVLHSLEGVAHPALVVKNEFVDGLVFDIQLVFPILRKKAFLQAWRKYRYDENNKPFEPAEYTQKGTADSRRLIVERIHAIISTINFKKGGRGLYEK